MGGIKKGGEPLDLKQQKIGKGSRESYLDRLRVGKRGKE